MIAQLDKEYIKTRPYKIFSRLVSYLCFEGRPATTKGRWINSLVFFLFRIIRILPSLKKVRQPIFIIGTGRSGTTLLGIILSMHKKVAYLNEPKALWHSIYEQEDIIGSYSEENGKYRIGRNEVSQKVRKIAYKLYGACLRLTCSDRIVDKYPELVFRVDFVKEIFPDAKFIFLVRNLWDTCGSIELWSQRKGVNKDGVKEDWWGVNDRKWKILVAELVNNDDELMVYYEEIKGYENHKLRAVVEWYLAMKEGLLMKDNYPDNMLLVKYEELLVTPKPTLKSILNFSDLPDDKAFYEYALKTILPIKAKPVFEIPEYLKVKILEINKRLQYDVKRP